MGFFAERCPRCGVPIAVRTPAQNVAMQKLCGALARAADWPRGSGKRLDAKRWKHLLIASWEREHERLVEIYPALDGVGWDVVYRRSSRLSSSEMSELLEFGNAFAVDLGLDPEEIANGRAHAAQCA